MSLNLPIQKIMFRANRPYLLTYHPRILSLERLVVIVAAHFRTIHVSDAVNVTALRRSKSIS